MSIETDTAEPEVLCPSCEGVLCEAGASLNSEKTSVSDEEDDSTTAGDITLTDEPTTPADESLKCELKDQEPGLSRDHSEVVTDKILEKVQGTDKCQIRLESNTDGGRATESQPNKTNDTINKPEPVVNSGLRRVLRRVLRRDSGASFPREFSVQMCEENSRAVVSMKHAPPPALPPNDTKMIPAENNDRRPPVDSLEVARDFALDMAKVERPVENENTLCVGVEQQINLGCAFEWATIAYWENLTRIGPLTRVANWFIFHELVHMVHICFIFQLKVHIFVSSTNFIKAIETVANGSGGFSFKNLKELNTCRKLPQIGTEKRK